MPTGLGVLTIELMLYLKYFRYEFTRAIECFLRSFLAIWFLWSAPILCSRVMMFLKYLGNLPFGDQSGPQIPPHLKGSWHFCSHQDGLPQWSAGLIWWWPLLGGQTRSLTPHLPDVAVRYPNSRTSLLKWVLKSPNYRNNIVVLRWHCLVVCHVAPNRNVTHPFLRGWTSVR